MNIEQKYSSDVAIQITGLSTSLPRTRRLRDVVLHPLRSEWIEVLSDINLQVSRGEIVGLVGPNGAGKTTFLRILSGLLLPTTGNVSVFGHDVVTDEYQAKARVGYVPADERSFLLRLTGYQNMEFFARLQDLCGDEIRKAVMRCLAQVGLREYADVPFMNYSSGMKQRLSFARGLLASPELLVLDEPTRSLDPISAKEIRALVKDLCSKQRMTTVISSHNLQEVEFLCDRIAVIGKGRLLMVGTPHEIRSSAPTAQVESYRFVLRTSPALIAEIMESAGLLSWTVSSSGCDGTCDLDVTAASPQSVRELCLLLLQSDVHVESWYRTVQTLEESVVGVSSHA